MAKISPFLDGRTIRFNVLFANLLLRRVPVVFMTGADGRLVMALVGIALINGDRETNDMPSRNAIIAAIAAAVDGLASCSGEHAAWSGVFRATMHSCGGRVERRGGLPTGTRN
nr:unnamed protein product [Digitaria exilis]